MNAGMLNVEYKKKVRTARLRLYILIRFVALMFGCLDEFYFLFVFYFIYLLKNKTKIKKKYLEKSRKFVSGTNFLCPSKKCSTVQLGSIV